MSSFLAGIRQKSPADIVPVGIGSYQDGYAGIKVGSAVTLYRAHAAGTCYRTILFWYWRDQ